jgi:penicillin amidase
MYGDARDNVAWWASGKLYKHKEGVDTIYFGWCFREMMILSSIWIFHKEPSASKPEWNYVLFGK